MAHLAGSTALVTGASRGIGRAVAAVLATHGVRIAVNWIPGTILVTFFEIELDSRIPKTYSTSHFGTYFDAIVHLNAEGRYS